MVMPSALIFFFFLNKLHSAFIWNRRLFIKIYTYTRHLKGTLQLIETQLVFGHLR